MQQLNRSASCSYKLEEVNDRGYQLLTTKLGSGFGIVGVFH